MGKSRQQPGQKCGDECAAEQRTDDPHKIQIESVFNKLEKQRMSDEININWSPLEYITSAVIAREIQTEMLSRLPLLALKPDVILDAGCGAGEGARGLQDYFPQACVIALDQSLPMLEQTRQAHSACVCAAAEALPLADNSVDFIFANLLLPWLSAQKIWREWRRVLKPNGLLMFSAFGLDTLRECHGHIAPQLFDMHDLGDAVLAAGFSDPVLDVNYLTTQYRSPEKLIAELRATGMIADSHLELVQAEDGKYPVTYEVVIGHAFAPVSAPGEFRIPVSSLRNSDKV